MRTGSHRCGSRCIGVFLCGNGLQGVCSCGLGCMMWIFMESISSESKGVVKGVLVVCLWGTGLFRVCRWGYWG